MYNYYTSLFCFVGGMIEIFNIVFTSSQPTLYHELGAKLSFLQCVSTGETIVSHQAIDMLIMSSSESCKCFLKNQLYLHVTHFKLMNLIQCWAYFFLYPSHSFIGDLCLVLGSDKRGLFVLNVHCLCLLIIDVFPIL